MVNFRIVEQSSTALPDYFYDFVKDYLTYFYTMGELKEKYGLNNTKLARIRREAEEKGLIPHERYCNYTVRNYYFNKSCCKWVVQKKIGKQPTKWGNYYTEEEAKEVVKLLNECNWDRTQLPLIKQIIRSKRK